jgi:hypothetical protein
MENGSRGFVMHPLRKFLHVFFALAGLPFVIVFASLNFIDVNKYDNDREIRLLEGIIAVAYIGIPLLVILATIAWHIKDLQSRKNAVRFPNEKIVYYCIVMCRYLLASIMLFYGISKIMGKGQLSLSLLQYGEEVGSMRGTDLTWAFFSHSKVYNLFIAWSEIFTGLLLLFRRTSFAGAIFLFPILLNIFIIDFCFDVDAKDIISVLLLMDIFLLSVSFKTLYALFIRQKIIDPGKFVQAYSYPAKQNKSLKLLAIVLVFAIAFLPGFVSQKKYTPNILEGAWQATGVNNYTDTIPEKNKLLNLRMFIEGGSATIKKTYQYQDFKMSYDSSQNTFISFDSWHDSLHKNQLKVHYQLVNNDSLVIAGTEGKDSIRWIFKRTHH